jgi:hypothetical protein
MLPFVLLAAFLALMGVAEERSHTQKSTNQISLASLDNGNDWKWTTCVGFATGQGQGCQSELETYQGFGLAVGSSSNVVTLDLASGSVVANMTLPLGSPPGMSTLRTQTLPSHLRVFFSV